MDAKEYIPALRYGAQIGGDNIETDTLEATDIAAGAVGTSELAAAAVTKTKLSYEVVAITVAAAASSGTGTVTTGSIIIGYYPTGNQDQLVDNIAISTTTLTVTLAAAATGDNTFNVICLKA